jgi:hypothetical protein
MHEICRYSHLDVFSEQSVLFDNSVRHRLGLSDHCSIQGEVSDKAGNDRHLILISAVVFRKVATGIKDINRRICLSVISGGRLL